MAIMPSRLIGCGKGGRHAIGGREPTEYAWYKAQHVRKERMESRVCLAKHCNQTLGDAGLGEAGGHDEKQERLE